MEKSSHFAQAYHRQTEKRSQLAIAERLLFVCFCMLYCCVFLYCLYCSMGSPDSNKLIDWLVTHYNVNSPDNSYLTKMDEAMIIRNNRMQVLLLYYSKILSERSCFSSQRGSTTTQWNSVTLFCQRHYDIIRLAFRLNWIPKPNLFCWLRT